MLLHLSMEAPVLSDVVGGVLGPTNEPGPHGSAAQLQAVLQRSWAGALQPSAASEKIHYLIYHNLSTIYIYID